MAALLSTVWPVCPAAAKDEAGAEPAVAAAVQAEPSTLLVRVTVPAKFIGFPAVCPGSSPDEDQSQMICMAELYEARVRVLRRLGGAPTPAILKVRFTAHSFHAVWRRDTRFLLIVRPFEDQGDTGHFAFWWKWENAEGKFCREREEVAKEEWQPLRRLFAGRSARTVGAHDEDWSEGSEIVCVNGRERIEG